MGNYDGAETCELVGCYLLAQLKQIPGIEIGLYRDDGLAILNQTPREVEKAKKQICQVFTNKNLKVTVEANKKIVNFLDVTLDLNTGKFKPYSKPSSTPLYVHSQSNHPPNIIRNIPEAINRRLSCIRPIKRFLTKQRPRIKKRYGRAAIHSSLNSNPHLRKHHHRSANAGEMLYGLIHHITKTSKTTSGVSSSALSNDLFHRATN